MIIDRETIETLVGTKISKIDLYQKAFTHKSALKENENLESFETLEFIGDSVLGFVITKFLFDRYEQQKEGFLTKARTKLVRGETLANIAMKLEMYKWIQMDEKGMRNEWFKNPKILEDVFEAFIGAIYMDLGLLHAKRFILNIYENPELVDMRSIMIEDSQRIRSKLNRTRLNIFSIHISNMIPVPILFISITLFLRKPHMPIQYSKQWLIEECERLGTSSEGTSRILRHRINRLKGSN